MMFQTLCHHDDMPIAGRRWWWVFSEIESPRVGPGEWIEAGGWYSFLGLRQMSCGVMSSHHATDRNQRLQRILQLTNFLPETMYGCPGAACDICWPAMEYFAAEALLVADTAGVMPLATFSSDCREASICLMTSARE